MASNGAKATAGLGAIGVGLSGLAHFGALGDDIARQSRVVLRGVGMYNDTILTIDDGARAMEDLRNGGDAERAAALAGCTLIGQFVEYETSYTMGYSKDEWESRINSELPIWVANEATGTVDDAVEKVATALVIGQQNARAGILYSRYCARY